MPRLSDLPLAEAEGPVNSVAFRPDGAILAAGYGGVRGGLGGGGVVLFDVARAPAVDQPLAGVGVPVSSVAFHPTARCWPRGTKPSFA